MRVIVRPALRRRAPAYSSAEAAGAGAPEGRGVAGGRGVAEGRGVAGRPACPPDAPGVCVCFGRPSLPFASGCVSYACGSCKSTQQSHHT